MMSRARDAGNVADAELPERSGTDALRRHRVPIEPHSKAHGPPRRIEGKRRQRHEILTKQRRPPPHVKRVVMPVRTLSEMDVPDRLVARAVRLGVFRHARPGTAGGVTVGYRRGRGDRGRDHDGVELGFPWIVRTCARTGRCWLRFEPRYRMPLRKVSWRTASYNYHLEATFLVGTSPFFVGGSADLRAPYKSGGARSFTVALVAGLRVGRPGAPGLD